MVPMSFLRSNLLGYPEIIREVTVAPAFLGWTFAGPSVAEFGGSIEAL